MSRTEWSTGERCLLASLVGDPEAFMNGVFGVRPWRSVAPQLPPFGVAAVDELVAGAVRVPAIRMVRDGRRVPQHEFCSPLRIGSTTVHDAADARKVLDAYRRGATLVLQSLQRHHAPMIEWCCALEAAVGWPVQANAYLTPPGRPGLDRHRDGHDVVAVQLHGTKRWDVEGLGRFDLEAGEVLYLPAGTEHEASTTDTASLHLTVGIHRPTEDRLLRTAFDMSRERAPEGGFGEVADVLRGVDPDEVRERLRRPARRPVGGLLTGAVTREAVGPELVIRPSRFPWTVRRTDADGSCSVEWGDQRLRLPSRARTALVAISEAAAGIRVADIPQIGHPDDVAVVVRRLLDEGAVVIVG